MKQLETVKSVDTSVEEKKQSGGLLKKFFESFATEGGKQVIKELVENGVDYAQYLM